MLNLPHQDRLSDDTKPSNFILNRISTVSQVRCACQGLGLVARIEASILVFDTMQFLYGPVLGQARPVLKQNRFCIKTCFVA